MKFKKTDMTSRYISHLQLVCIAHFLLYQFCLARFLQSQTHLDSRPDEYQLKAAFLYNFAKFITWPDDSLRNKNNTFYIGVFGNNPFEDYLKDVIANKTIRGRKIEVFYFRKFNDITPCHILFISDSEQKRLRHIFHKLDTTGILTVGDMSGFCQSGGIINFIVKDKKVRFEINIDAAKRSDLVISSKLLRLATIIREKKTGRR